MTPHNYDLPETAKAIKLVLSVLWPGTKFSVKSERYSGGCSITAAWVDGPTDKDVRAVMDVFQDTHFDGMTDSTSHSGPEEWNGHRFKFRTGYCSGSREQSFSLLGECACRFAKETGLEPPAIHQEGNHVWVDRADGKPCGYSFHGPCEDYPEGVICREADEGHWTAADVIGQMAIQTRTEVAAFELGRHGYIDEWATTKETVLRIVLGELAPEPQQSPAAGAVEGVTVSENEEKDGVEIRFPGKPPQAVIDSLKAHGWRWSRFGSCWWHKRTPDILTFAHGLQGSPTP